MGESAAHITALRGERILIDAEAMPLVSPIRWRVAVTKNGTRFVRTCEGYMRLAQFICGSEHGVHIRHANGDPLDCRRENLIVVTGGASVVHVGEFAKVELRNSDMAALVDSSDAELVSGHAWYLSPQGYAVGKCGFMHRMIVQPRDGYCIDHIDRNKLNNRRSNLREATAQNNVCNSRNMAGKTSAFKGVYFDKAMPRTPYKVTIQLNRKQIHVGRFRTETEAAMAYDAKAREMFGEFACTNADLGLL